MRYFKPEEFTCGDKIVFGMMQPSLLNHLEIMRINYGSPIHINSSFRDAETNKQVNGEKNSAHMEGYAVDVSCPDSTSRFKMVKAAQEAGFRRIGIGSNFIHVDTDPTKPQDVIWLY